MRLRKGRCRRRRLRGEQLLRLPSREGKKTGAGERGVQGSKIASPTNANLRKREEGGDSMGKKS